MPSGGRFRALSAWWEGPDLPSRSLTRLGREPQQVRRSPNPHARSRWGIAFSKIRTRTRPDPTAATNLALVVNKCLSTRAQAAPTAFTGLPGELGEARPGSTARRSPALHVPPPAPSSVKATSRTRAPRSPVRSPPYPSIVGEDERCEGAIGVRLAPIIGFANRPSAGSWNLRKHCHAQELATVVLCPSQAVQRGLVSAPRAQRASEPPGPR